MAVQENVEGVQAVRDAFRVVQALHRQHHLAALVTLLFGKGCGRPLHFGFAGRLSIALVVDSERERVDLGETSVHCQGSARILYACYAPTA